MKMLYKVNIQLRGKFKLWLRNPKIIFMKSMKNMRNNKLFILRCCLNKKVMIMKFLEQELQNRLQKWLKVSSLQALHYQVFK